VEVDNVTSIAVVVPPTGEPTPPAITGVVNDTPCVWEDSSPVVAVPVVAVPVVAGPVVPVPVVPVAVDPVFAVIVPV
jgi:hypothetical protein